MNIVAVITNDVKAFDYFISQLNKEIDLSFRFKRVEALEDLKGILPVAVTQLSAIGMHREAEEIAYRLEGFALPRFDGFDFTKHNEEILKLK